jgi:hypothetical protein
MCRHSAILGELDWPHPIREPPWRVPGFLLWLCPRQLALFLADKTSAALNSIASHLGALYRIEQGQPGWLDRHGVVGQGGRRFGSDAHGTTSLLIPSPDSKRQAGPGFSPSSRILQKSPIRRPVSRAVSWLGTGSRSSRRRSSLRPTPHTQLQVHGDTASLHGQQHRPDFSCPSPGDKDLVRGGPKLGDAIRSASSEYSLQASRQANAARANAARMNVARMNVAMIDPTRVIRDPLISVNRSFLSLISCYPYSPLISICISLLLLASIVPPLHWPTYSATSCQPLTNLAPGLPSPYPLSYTEPS